MQYKNGAIVTVSAHRERKTLLKISGAKTKNPKTIDNAGKTVHVIYPFIATSTIAHIPIATKQHRANVHKMVLLLNRVINLKNHIFCLCFGCDAALPAEDV